MKSTPLVLSLCTALACLGLGACSPESTTQTPNTVTAEPNTLALAEAVAPATTMPLIPTDADQTCVVDPATFDGWFASGNPAANGPVKPASSVSFTTDNPNGGSGPNVCNFYQWGAQMFLWLTSPAGDGLVLDGPPIFTVTPAGADGQRTLIPNSNTGANFGLALRTTKGDDIGEVGQAGGSGVLVSQKGALVYYGIAVNDVYAYFLSGQKGTSPLSTATDFPRNAADLKAVVDYAQQTYSASLAAPEALAMELKSSWVDATTVENPETFVTITAEVPVFTPNTANTKWTSSGTATKQLALVGLHVVGTVQDHPEFVWATFEHVSNAPDNDYYYTNNQQQVVKHSYSAAGDFLFMASGASNTTANVECAHATSANVIEASSKSNDDPTLACGGIVASNTVRTNPWGSPGNDPSEKTVKNNTLLLSINESVRSQLAASDVRSNYIQVGGIWTTTPPSGGDAPIPNQNGDQTAQMRGSLKLANATMETYHQTLDCFVCHRLNDNAANSFGKSKLSHIYSEIKALPAQ